MPHEKKLLDSLKSESLSIRYTRRFWNFRNYEKGVITHEKNLKRVIISLSCLVSLEMYFAPL